MCLRKGYEKKTKKTPGLPKVIPFTIIKKNKITGNKFNKKSAKLTL